MKRVLFVLVLLFSLCFPALVSADEPRIVIIGSTIALEDDLKNAIIQTLEANPPSETRFYGITYIQNKGNNQWLVSVVGTTAEDPKDFELTENAVWMGSLQIQEISPGQWEGNYLSALRQKERAGLSSLPFLSIPLFLPFFPPLGAGGGSEIELPFSDNTNAMYGIMGVHGNTELANWHEWAPEQMWYVDLIGGPGVGNSMTDSVYASASGTIEYICTDGTTVAIGTVGDAPGNDYFLYAHLLDNANLELEHYFTRGQLIGKLKHGTFITVPYFDCGSAWQNDDNYHLHWGIEAKDAKFRVENWQLNISNGRWTNSQQAVVSPGGVIYNGASYIPPHDQPGEIPIDIPANGATPISFWDLIIYGLYGIANVICALLPPHDANAVFVAIWTAVGVALRIIYTIADTVLNLAVLWAVLVLILILESVRLIGTILRFLKKYIPKFL